MKRYFMYLLVYSVGGFILERIINLIFLQEWYDNSVLVGPYQPLYGNGVLLGVLFMEYVYPKIRTNTIIKEGTFILVAIAATALSEATTGYFFEWLTGIHLWDYGQTFPCNLEYVCLLPTSLFGFFSYLVIKYLHPVFKPWLDRTPNTLFIPLLAIIIIDIVYTFYNLL